VGEIGGLFPVIFFSKFPEFVRIKQPDGFPPICHPGRCFNFLEVVVHQKGEYNEGKDGGM
jgi:hypothetical protein